MKRIQLVILSFFISISSLAQNSDNYDSLMLYYNQTKKPVPNLSLDTITEYAPSISADGKRMIVQYNLNGRDLLYETTRDNKGEWTTPKPITTINNFNGKAFIFAPSISFDGNSLYFCATYEEGDQMNIYFSRRLNDGWSEPEPIPGKVNTPTGYEGFPSISADGKTLYFVKGPGKEDLRKNDEFCTSIYSSRLQDNGEWDVPMKLPAPVNIACEKAPRIMADGRTLIFSSNREGGKGGYDMYQSRMNEINEWSYAYPLDYVNTAESDQLPCISPEGDEMYYVYGGGDIYTVTIPPSLRQFKNVVINGNIVDSDTEQGIATDVVVKDALTSEDIMRIPSNEGDGAYLVVLPTGNSYNIEVNEQGYSGFFKNIDLRDVDQYYEQTIPIELFNTVRLTLNINDKELFTPVEARVQVREQGKSSFLKEYQKISNGRITVDVPLGRSYEFIISKENYKSEIFSFDISQLVMYRDFEKEIELEPEKVEVTINVADLMNDNKVRSKIVLRNKDRDEYIEVNGNETIKLRAGDRYELEATSDQGYAFNSTVLDVSRGGSQNVDIKLQKLELEARLSLKDILFETNSAALNEISYIELNRVIQMMRENPTLKIEIAAHTDDVGSDQYNQNLAQQRAQSVVDYLLENNLQEERFVARGYGESQPKVSNDTEENRAINRRVEIIILGV